METTRWFRRARALVLAFAGVCTQVACPSSDHTPSAIVTSPFDATSSGTGGMAAFTGAPGSGGIGSSGTGGVNGIGSGSGGISGSGGASVTGSGGIGGGSGGTPGTGGTTTMNGGAGGSDAGGMAGDGAGANDAGAQYNPCPDDGSPCKILPLGDSITYGIQLPGAYRIELFRQAVAAGQNITYVGSQKNGPAMVDGVAFPQSHEGYSGYTIDQIDQMILTPALAFEPDIITLMIGTNDMYGANPAGAPDRLDHLLDDIFDMNGHALLVLAQLTPLGCCMTTVDGYNQALAQRVAQRAAAGKHVIMVDMSATMISNDNVHPNEAGYTHMGQVWYAAIGDLLPKKK